MKRFTNVLPLLALGVSVCWPSAIRAQGPPSEVNLNASIEAVPAVSASLVQDLSFGAVTSPTGGENSGADVCVDPLAGTAYTCGGSAETTLLGGERPGIVQITGDPGRQVTIDASYTSFSSADAVLNRLDVSVDGGSPMADPGAFNATFDAAGSLQLFLGGRTNVLRGALGAHSDAVITISARY